MINEWINKQAIERYCTPHGDANPQTEAYAEGFVKGIELTEGFSEWMELRCHRTGPVNKPTGWRYKYTDGDVMTTSELLIEYIKTLEK